MLGNFHDNVNLLSKLTLKKIWNAIQVVISYIYSRISNKPTHFGNPVSVSIEPTTSCNLRCPECPSGLRSFTRPTGMLHPDLFEKIVTEIGDRLMYLLFYFQGEPYLHPQFIDLVKIASQKNIYTATSTNAHYLSNENARKTVESGLDRLIISIDGVTQESYESYRVGGDLEKVIEGTKNVIKWKNKLNKKKPYVIFQFLVVKPNEHEIEKVKFLGKELGVDKVAFKTAQIYDYEGGSPLIPDNQVYSRYKFNPIKGKFLIKNRFFNHCWKMWHSCVITWDGKVVPCCFDKDAHFVLGNLNKDYFNNIWKSKEYINFRKSIINGRKHIEMCKNCTEGTKVWT
ncbi:MAG: SPASM domain-containing protein [Cyclobacteriaceae bacterium]|nr:SPASM domain-containing protein [Cyclobacteriaceae bacterium]